MKVLRLPLFVLIAVFATDALAGNRPNFNYFGIGYAYDDLEDYNCTQDGLFLEGSLSYDEQVFIQARHVDVTSNDPYGCGSTTTQLSLGLRGDYGTSSVLYGKASVLFRDYGDDSDPGLGMSFGVRSIVANGLEAEGFIGYETVDSFSQSYVGGAANYWISRDFSLRATISTTSKSTTGFTFGVRFNL